MKQEEFFAMYEKLNASKKKKISGVAKWFTIIVIGAVFVVGVFGSFDISKFHMTDYIAFLDSFKWFISPLILGVGAGGVVKGIGKNKSIEIEAKAKMEPMSFEEQPTTAKARAPRKSQETPWVELQSQ